MRPKLSPWLERLIGPLVIDVFADDRRFGDDPAVMYKHRNDRVWNQLEVFGPLRVAAAQIEVDNGRARGPMILFVAVYDVDEHALKPPQQSSEGYSQPNATDHLTLEIVFGETRYDLARKRTDSPFAFLTRISAI